MTMNLAVAQRIGQTLRVVAPLATHWRRATCQDVADGAGCEAYRHGWTNTLPTASPAADYIRQRRRTRTNPRGLVFEERVLPAGQSVFVFEAGQECFRGRNGQHGVVQVGRPGLLLAGVPGQSSREMRLIGDASQEAATREFTERLAEGTYAVRRMHEIGMVE